MTSYDAYTNAITQAQLKLQETTETESSSIENLVSQLEHLIRDYNLSIIDEDKKALIEIASEIAKVSNNLLKKTKLLNLN
jgi:hypothetical protein